MRALRLLVLAALPAAILGCSSSARQADRPLVASTAGAPPPADDPQPAGAMMPAYACPMAVPGARVQVANTKDGVALTFRAMPMYVGEMRERVRGMATMYGAHGGMMGEGMMGPHMGAPQTQGMMGPYMTMPMARVTVEETDGGARMLMTPADPATRGALRDAMRSYAAELQRGVCPMMGSMTPAR